MRAHFPFTAIVGQDRLKTALLLISIDASIGGLLVCGPRGSAKSTMVRSLASLNRHQPFVTVPLGASEEMVIGSLNLEQALRDAKLAFKPGLLAKANHGILYVDEVNLLADNLVDLLLDAAASGTNLIERDGISHQHDALFSLVGTMNPDEGELRPQLLDRFGLMAEVDVEFSIEQRQSIVKRRLAFDSNPDDFIEQQQHQLSALQASLDWAKANLASVVVSDAISEQIAQRCADANVEGFRADITMYRAARANAALNRRLQVCLADLDSVEALVLNHRRQAIPPLPPPSQQHGPSSANGGSNKPQNGSSIQGSWGAMETVTTETHCARVLPDQTTASMSKPANSKAPNATGKGKGGSMSRRFLSRISAGASRIDWFHSLALKQQKKPLTLNDIKYCYAQPRSSELKLILLDTSASTLCGQGLAQANGVLKELSRQAYLKRQQIGIVSFGNNQVTTLIHPQRAPKNIQPQLDSMRAGGGTPIHKALDYAQCLLKRQGYRHLDCSVYLVTDGRLQQSVKTHSLFNNYRITIVDIESSRVRLGLGRQLADAISARYLPLSALTAC